MIGQAPRKVYVVSVIEWTDYGDSYNDVGVYATREAAERAMAAQGFDVKTRSKVMPWDDFEDEPDWRENGWFYEYEYKIEDWEVSE